MTQSSSTSRSPNKKLIIFGAIFVILIVGLLIWNKQRHTQNEQLVIGISPPFAHPLQAAAKEAEKQGIHVKLVEFSDWNTPNITLNNGDIDANFFQHQPFLSNVIKETGYKLKAFGVGAASHVGLYSKKYKSLDELPQNARVVIPNDPVNQGRALLLLQQAKLIELKDPNNYLSKLSDISNNPKHLQFVEVEGPQTARAIDDVDLAFGYPNYLRLAKTVDPESALVLDDTTNKRYAILFVVRDDYQDKGDKLKKFVEIYQNSPEVKAALNQDIGAKLWFPGWV
ncbi:methionine transporter [Acinetobacter guerrae]|uniref:Methionine transporter n=1 Tax=Acinetobacter guerrae TaxID=1843371 RepID=A0A3A8ENJ7_9GAMM|nr:MetQ/NlpA family ABC transporter substrate-binding protein [Acinetobacter guerrae]MPW44902.1 methionine transporter [Acinetobacter guerrae]RKG35738.1 methionine transporter [Acinetobacter guerrae]